MDSSIVVFLQVNDIPSHFVIFYPFYYILCIKINYNNDRCVFIYLCVRNALPMIPLSQVKVSYIPRFYRSPLKHLFSYY